MNDDKHWTPIVARGHVVLAQCTQHGTVGGPHERTRRGVNACRTEARAHDDLEHGVYRTDEEYRARQVRRS